MFALNHHLFKSARSELWIRIFLSITLFTLRSEKFNFNSIEFHTFHAPHLYIFIHPLNNSCYMFIFSTWHSLCFKRCLTWLMGQCTMCVYSTLFESTKWTTINCLNFFVKIHLNLYLRKTEHKPINLVQNAFIKWLNIEH